MLHRKMDKALTHIALHVHDLDASLRFYEDYAQMVDTTPREDQSSAWLSSHGKEGDFALVLVPGAKEKQDGNAVNTTRLGFTIESKEKLRDIYACAVKNKTVVQAYEESADGQRASFRMTDPNGFLVEFWTSQSSPEQSKLNNITLHVGDMEVSKAFYEEWAGMGVLQYGQVSKSVRMVSPNEDDAFQLILCDQAAEPLSRAQNDVGHVGIALSSLDDLKAIYDKAQDAGIVDIPWMEMKPPVGTLFMIRDPDGNRVEFSYGQPLGNIVPQAQRPHI